jgi:hypothetical protein
MNGSAVPAVLRERLGAEATEGLLEVLDAAQREWRNDVIAVCTDRFESRLAVEIAHVEAAMRQGDAALRQEMTELGAGLRQEMTELGAGLRQEMAQMATALRQEIGQLGSGLRQEISDGRFELLKWCFLFWAGQVVAIAGILAVMLRMFRP